MPRPRVPADKRLRIAEACNFCRESKKRCSGSAPCTQCLRRGLENRCFITYAPRGSRARARREASKRAAASNTDLSTQEPSGLMGIANTISQHNVHAGDPDIVNEFRPLSPSDSRRDGEEGGSLSEHTEASASNPPRMLLNLRGERGKRCIREH